MNPSDRPETSGSEPVRYLVTIDLARGRTLKVLRQLPDGSLHEVTRRPLGSDATSSGLPEPWASQSSPASTTLH